MTIAEQIVAHVKALPESLQSEVLDFLEYLESRAEVAKGTQDELDWCAFSLSQAMRGMESESSPYTTDDLKETFS